MRLDTVRSGASAPSGACPDCAGELVDVQGRYACRGCDWIEPLDR